MSCSMSHGAVCGELVNTKICFAGLVAAQERAAAPPCAVSLLNYFARRIAEDGAVSGCRG
jgi:hypothetical protein